jgi:hypothetical protein
MIRFTTWDLLIWTFMAAMYAWVLADGIPR